MALSKRKRFEIFKRDAFTCQYCGRQPPLVTLEVDHVTAVSRGGTDHCTNLVTACFDCNRGKSDRELNSIPAAAAEQIEVAMEQIAQMKAFNKFLLQARKDLTATVQRLSVFWCDLVSNGQGRLALSGQRLISLRHFATKLTEAGVMESMETAAWRMSQYRKSEEQLWK